MRIAVISLALFGVVAFAQEEDLATQSRLNATAIRKNYDEIKRNSSPAFQKFKDEIEKGDADFSQISSHYEDVLARLEYLKELRRDVDKFNDYARLNNDEIERQLKKKDDAAARQMELADLEARRSKLVTEISDKEKVSWTVKPDGTLVPVSTTEVGITTKEIRENQVIAQRRAELQKRDIHEKNSDDRVELILKKIAAVDCATTLDQIAALSRNENTKFKYLMAKKK